MASYGNIYRFMFRSHNGWNFEILIAKKDYTGEVYTRPLGRSPLLRRDNNSGVYGTSLEIYAECKVPGEYAQLYTSSAYEYQIQLYRNGVNLWTGFLTPELYSEPDRPAPYDVRIVATDGLGELKRYKFYSNGAQTLRSHLETILAHTGVERSIVLLSTLSYDTGSSMALPPALLDMVIDLSHEDGNKCYDVLQNILVSLHAGISLQNNQWFLFRPTDFVRRTDFLSLSVYAGDNPIVWPIAWFGTMRLRKWWPIGNMSVTVDPAKNGVELTSPFHYKENMLDESWILGNTATYNSDEKAYVLPDSQAYISQQLDFGDDPISYRLALRLRALNVGTVEEAQNIGIRIKIDGTSYSGAGNYWLYSISSDRYGKSVTGWSKNLASIESELAVPGEGQNEKDAQEIEVVIPLYYKDSRGFVRANNMQVEVFNPSGVHSIHIYEVTLAKYDQAEGTVLDVILDNNAREKATAVDLQMIDGSTVPEGGRWSMTGLPFAPNGSIIASWLKAGLSEPVGYLDLMAQDYAQVLGSARLRYTGRLNVPYGEDLPCLFMREGTYYWPRVYSYDLYNDELEVELVNVPDAGIAKDIKTYDSLGRVLYDANGKLLIVA